MSEFTETERENDKSCQKKLAPPRSLEDDGENGQRVWEMITKRYPKAAPLFYEMEAAIQRAESVLHQLKNVPYDRGSDESCTSKVSYSANLERRNSMSSAQESSSISEESTTNNEVEEVGTRISYDRIPQSEEPSSSNSSENVGEPDLEVSGNLVCRDKTNGQSAIKDPSQSNKVIKKTEQLKEIKSPSPDHKRDSVKMADHINSIEDCGKGSEKLVNSRKSVIKREIPIRCDNRSRHFETASIGQNTKSDKLKTNESSRPFGENGSNIGDNNATTRAELTSTKKKDLSRKRFDHKTAVEILLNYAEQIDRKVEFNILHAKPNSLKIECIFADYKAVDVGYPESEVHNKVAATILRLMAGRQIDEQDMKDLVPFSDDQMRDIVALGTGGEPENAVRKLYKLCLEKNEPKPVYKIRGRSQITGVNHSAECAAFGKIARGDFPGSCLFYEQNILLTTEERKKYYKPLDSAVVSRNCNTR